MEPAVALGFLTGDGAVDLDSVEGEALQIGQRGIAGAEIIERQSRAEILDPSQNLRREFRIFHHQAFAELQL